MAPLLLVWTLALGLAWAKTTWTVPSGPWPRWTVGDIQTIEYTTTETEYTIALWQQLDGAGTLGPILFQTTNGPNNEFDWVVQTYNFNLATSDKFFLWLFAGDGSNQGNMSVKRQQSSGFFYIDKASTSSSSEPSSTATASSSLSEPTTTASSEPTTTADSGATTTADAEATSSSSSSSLSTGAKAGIGVGVGVGGAAAIAAALFFILRRRRRPRTDDNLGELPDNQVAPDAAKTSPPPMYELPGRTDTRISELGS